MKKVMAKIRKPVSLVLVVALIISMSAFVFGFTNNNRAALVGHYGFVSASATAIMDEEIIIQIPEETQDSGGYEEEYIPKSAYTEEYEAYASGDAYDSEDYYASSLEAYEAYASEDTYSSEDYYAPSFEEYEADAFEDAYGSEDYYAPSSDEYEADAFEDAYGSEDYYAPSLEEYEPDAFEDAYDDAGETHDPEYCDVYGCEYCIVSDGQIATAAATVNGITQDGAGTSEESDAPAQSAASTAATPNGVVQGGESGQPAPPADTFATNFSDLRNFVSNVTVLDLNGVPLEPVPPEDISNPFDQTYRFVIEFSEYLSEYYTLQFEQNELTGRLYYMLPSGLEMPAPVAQTPIRAEPVEEDELGLIIGWYTISADGLVEVWFESITIEGSEIPYEMSFIEFYTDIVLEITIDAILLEESGGIIDFGNYWVLEVPPVYYDFGIMSTLEGITPFASANDWDLSNFVTSVNIFDMTDIEDPLGTPDNPNPIGPGDSTFLGTTYRFDITFREDSSRQFDVDVLGNMTFRLPQTIEVKAAISNLDIRYGLDNRGAIIGRYSVTPGGGESNLPAMVIVTWYEVDNNGNPTPGTLWINNYTNCQFVLSIFAHLLPGSGGGNLDFGDGGITIEEPVQPEPRLDIVKKSAFNPETMTIDYTVFIQALRAPVLLYSWSDQLFVQIESQRPWPFPLGIPVNNPNVRPGIDNGFFSDFSYWLYLGGDLNPPEQIMEPSDEDEFGLFWGGTPATGSEVTYFDWFFEPIILDPETADYIRIEFTLDVNAMLEANNFFGMDHFQYDMIIVNYAAVIGMPPNADWDTEWLGAATTVADPIHKEFVFTKDGTFIGTPGPDGYPFINWNVQVGDGESIPLNGGWVVESLQDGLQLPPNTDITFKFYGIGSGNSQTPPPTPMFTLTAADLFITNPSPAPGNGSTFFELLSGQQFRLTIPPNTFIVPGTSEPLGDVYRLDISFSTNVTTGLPNPGMPPLNLRNEVDWFWPDGTGQPGPGATVPIRPPTAGLIEKTSGGICGPDAEGNYYIDYLITLKIPAGLAGAPLWIYDDLGVFPGGSGVNHLPTVTVTAFETGDATRAASARMLADPLRYTQPIQVNPNSWKMLFGTASPAGQVAWQYTFPVTVEISYRLVVPANRLQFLQTMPASGSPNYISNNVRLVNSANWNNPSAGIAEGQIVAINTQEWWPIFKSARETSNPALFNYTVTMLGRNKARPGTSFLNPDSAPIFRDAFDDRMMYVPDTFYVVRLSSPNAYFAPPTGTNILNASGDIEINLNNLVSWTAPPNQGGTQGAAVPGWFATTDKFEFHYDLLLLPEFQHSSIANLTNTATITRTLPTGCSFDATAVIPYNFNDLQKTMTPTRPGSDKVNVSIVINADGSRDFNDGVNIPGPNQIVAVDKLENLLLYVDSVKLYTQRLIILPNGTGMWDGVWTEVTHSLNDYKLWSVNAVATDEFAFVIPNRQPVLIEYQGLVTLLPGTTGSIKNTISIYGDSSSDGQGEYQVGDSEVGANANKIPVRVFKRDPLIPDQAVPPEASSNPGVLLPGARFELYAAVVSNPNNYTAPSGLTEAFPVVGTDLIVRNFYRLPDANIVHGADGITILNDPWLAPAHEIIFMLREVQAPPGYFLPTEPDNLTFFAINPRIFPSTHSFLPNPLNQISDFININNVVPISIEIVKIIETRTGTFPTQ
ncbi:MAG: hypothetical protein FWB75_02900, partial [Oscillospiraceae bacterium]|nr:hypothetical protein [Oscillospiraceae bacterium]